MTGAWQAVRSLLLLLSISSAGAFLSAASGTALTGGIGSSRQALSMILRTDADREGRKMGNPRAFEYLVDYPCKFQIKAVGHNKGNLADDLAALVGSVCEVEPAAVEYTVRDTDSGKYRSVTLMAPVSNSDMLYKCYEVIGQDERVRFKF
ncbi:hypothetical protein JKP88DRAFT_206811 [Tribonema minus]|uniref:Uncharacterized protein n=1 Tax=Tribonema minus TaxID=303371 RepID=A0A836CJU5_9STRA|nr:hypothetical protein JKP88DRAFT_206811 [Tribonema minus]